tara:strand:- start:142 stop:381 length:240 start_codon:yes stop_codon:yes gene_type:complete
VKNKRKDGRRERKTPKSHRFVFWRRRRSDNDERAEKKTELGAARFFVVGCGREERRYLFQTHSAEIECDGCEILVRSEW